MGRRGPPPKPTAALQGWRKAKRTREPKTMTAKPRMPKEIAADKELSRIWRDVAKRLEGQGLFSAADTLVIQRYVKLVWRHAHQEAELDKLVRESYLGPLLNEASRPLVQWLEKTVAASADRLTKLERELGLTATGRAAMGVLQQEATEQNEPGLSYFEGTG